MRSLLPLLVLAATIPSWAANAPYDPLNDPRRPIASSPSLTPAETAKALKVPPGFAVEVIAGEPQIKQPVAYTFDDRGRLWVLENTNYPVCPGQPRDRILILEDTKGTGVFDKQTVFCDNLTFSTGLAVGFGGVWVGSPPNLTLIPMKPGEDKPAGPPQVVLNGWAWEDTHETLNDFTWGPDGWLYGTQGVFTFSHVGAPGTPKEQRTLITAAVWRFHPLTGKFERYCEGASNQWGIDWNDHGQAFFEACVIPHVWQAIQGARYTRQAGQQENPNTYEDIKTIGDFEYEKRAYCGAMIYLGGLFPAEFRDTFFFNDIHMNKMRNERMERRGSGYVARRNVDFVVSSDSWYRALSPQYGPDGSVFLNDWYDKVPCHQQRDFTDRSNGRMYKITYTGVKPVQVDLTKATDAELVAMQLHENEWYVRHARRILQERGGSPAVREALVKMFREQSTEPKKLRALWALHAVGGLSEEFGLEALRDSGEYVRAWTIQLLCENGTPSAPILAELARLAKDDPSPVVRLYIASAAQRIAVAERWPLLMGLASHAEDAQDQNLPLMLWYAAEPAVAADPVQALDLLKQCKIGRVQEFIARRVAAVALQ